MKKLESNLLFGFLLICLSCQKENLHETDLVSGTPVTRMEFPEKFDWANADWMPTPPGQSRIPSPWNGPGSITSTYDMEIVNDRYKSDGWELIYNTFDANSPAPLSNPYFVLYNKYRGTIRFYLFLTTQFVAPSSYIQDGISIVSTQSTSMFRFSGKEIVDASAKDISQYDQIQPAPYDGSSPFATNRWYMLQYELAYDPNLYSIPYNQIQLKWYLNYRNVQEIILNGEEVGSVTGTIGSAGSEGILSAFSNLFRVTGTGVIAGVGVNIIQKNTVEEHTGANKLGLDNRIFKSIASGLEHALSGSATSLPGALFKGLSAIFGVRDNHPILVNLQFESKISLAGTLSEKGSFPSSPFSFWVPGTNISPDAVGQIPLYNKLLGVFNFNGRPALPAPYIIRQPTENPSRWDVYAVYKDHDFTKYLIINPEVSKIADIKISQEIIELNEDANLKYDSFILSSYVGTYEKGMRIDHNYLHKNLAVRFTIRITPKNGDSPSVIIKTFKIDQGKLIAFC